MRPKIAAVIAGGDVGHALLGPAPGDGMDANMHRLVNGVEGEAVDELHGQTWREGPHTILERFLELTGHAQGVSEVTPGAGPKVFELCRVPERVLAAAAGDVPRQLPALA